MWFVACSVSRRARRSARLSAFLAFCVAAAGAAPAAQQAALPAAAGSYLRAEDHRVAAIVYRLGVAGRRFCEEQLPLTGLLFHHLAEYEPRDRAGAIARYRLDRGIGVLSVIAGSPAAAAGIRAGDVLIAVNGTPFPSPVEIAAMRSRPQWRPLVEASEAQLEEQFRAGPARLAVLRGGQEIYVQLTGIMGCPARSRLARSSQSNAFADGRYAIMTTRFLGFFRSDDELAVAMAHELAHNILRHPQELETQGVPYGRGRHGGRNARLVRATEEEADRLSLRLLWAAGYDLSAAIPFWRRLYSRLDSRLSFSSAHPSFDARERVIREVTAELASAPPPSGPWPERR